MSDVGPESPSAYDSSAPDGAADPNANQSWPGATPGGAYPGPDLITGQSLPQPPARRMRGPLIGFIAGAVAVALGGGGYLVVHNLESGNNKPVATSAQARSGGITVAGHGIKMTFPAGWVNVPTSVNQARQFMKNFEDKYRHIPAALQNEVDNPQVLSSFAMLVVRFDALGNDTANLDALVTSPGPPPSQMISQLESGQGPAEFGVTDVHYTVTSFGEYPGVLVTYTLSVQGITLYGAQSYLDGPASTVVTTVTSKSSATSQADLTQIVDTISFT